MIVKVLDPKVVYVCVSRFGGKEIDSQWYASCLNPNYVPQQPPSYKQYPYSMPIYESANEQMIHTERLYFHKDGEWRTTCSNEQNEFTAYFKTKEELVNLLGNIKYSER